MAEYDPEKPTHFVLMRTDLPDYLAGKCMAQSNHAGTALVAHALLEEHPYKEGFLAWLNEGGGGFGTCIVKGVTHRQMLHRTRLCQQLGLVAGLVTDNGYPIRDGHTVTEAVVTTCAYVFGPRGLCDLAIQDLPLFVEDDDA